MALIMFLTLAVLLVLNVPIAMSLAISAILALLTGDMNIPLLVVGQRMFTSIDSFPLMAVPFFILSGDIMARGGISDRLIKLAKIFLNRLPASLAIITTASSAFFGALSGSNPATVAAIGGIMIPEMEKSGYKKDKAAAVAAASGTMGVVIPPSISMVTYAVTAGVSIGTMFIAGFVPGLLLALAIMTVGIIVNRNDEIQIDLKLTRKQKLKVVIDAIWALIMPVIILGGIYSGKFTPTESAAVAVVYAFLVAMFVYRELKVGQLPEILVKSATSTALVLFVVACSAPFTWLITSINFPMMLNDFVMNTFSNKYIIFLMVNVILLFLGMFLETQSIILLMTPILYPLLTGLGMDPITIGIILVVNTSVGMITPPMAVNLYVACGIAKISVGEISRRIMPYLFAELAVILALTYIPGLVTWLPNLLM